jgi:hypothetical protein
MKVDHDKVAVENFEPGKQYDVCLRGSALYRAEVLKFHGGCWATVKVLEAQNPETAKYYTLGATFDIKVAEYDITPA